MIVSKKQFAMYSHWIRGVCLLPFVSLFLILGCSRNPKTYPVQGVVVFPDNKPVHVGHIEFRARESNLCARGTIQEDGKFTLTTFESGDGAVAGEHDCVVVQRVIAENIAGHTPSTYGVIDPKHASYTTSGLFAVVNPVDKNEIKLVVERIRKDAGAASEKHQHDPSKKNPL